MRTTTTLGVVATTVFVIASALGAVTPAAASTSAGGQEASARTAAVPARTPALAATPPMGWNSYNAYACDNGSQNMEAVAKFVHDSGLEADGYDYINSDGCYDDNEGLGSPNTYGITAPIAQDPETCGAINGRLPNGELYVNSYAFPPSSPCADDGFALVGDDLHKLGLRLGLYLDAGNNWNCEEIPGSYGFDSTDAATLAKWGADYVKIDWGCGDSLVPPASNAPAGYTGIDADTGNQGFGGPTFSTNAAYDTDQQTTQVKMYTALVDAIRAQKRPITVSIAGAGTIDSAQWGLPMAQLDRPTGDANANFVATGRHAAGSVVGIVNADAQQYESLTTPGHWIDPDAMEVGNGTLTPAEDRSEMSMFSEMAEPLLMSTNLCAADCGPDTTPATKAQLDLAVSVFGNKRVIAVDQDALAAPAHIVGTFDGTHLVMTRELKNGDVAVTLFNESTTDATTMSATAAALGLPAASSYRVQDLWSGATTTTATGTVSATVAPTETVMYRISPIGAAHTTKTASSSRASQGDSSTHSSSTIGSGAGVSSATASTTPSALQSVSCASAHECAAVDEFGSAMVFDPAHPAKARRLAIDPGRTLVSVSCVSKSGMCTAIDTAGSAVTFAALGHGASSTHAIDPGGEPTAVDCVSTGQCTLVDGKGMEITFVPGTSHVTGRASVDPHTYLASVSCPSASQCTAAGGGGNNGDTEVTFDPRTGAVGAAGVTSLDAQTVNGVSSVSCSSTVACTVVDGWGNEVSFTPATGAALADGVTALEGDGLAAGLGVLTGVDCVSSDQCTGVDLSGDAVTYDPTTGAVSGAARNVDAGAGLRSVTCPTASECLGADLQGRVAVFAPLGAAASVTQIDAPVRWNARSAA